MSTPVLIVSAIAILIVFVILIALLRRSQKVEHDEPGVIIDATPAPPPPPPPQPLPPPATPRELSGPASVDGPQGNAVSDQIAAAMKDIAGEMTGVEAQPDTEGDTGAPAPAAAMADAPDAIILIKGLGPKFVKRLNQMGIDRFTQIAAWSDADIERIEGEIDILPGRIARDRWVEQAGYLARGDTPGFEERFGKLK